MCKPRLFYRRNGYPPECEDCLFCQVQELTRENERKAAVINSLTAEVEDKKMRLQVENKLPACLTEYLPYCMPAAVTFISLTVSPSPCLFACLP